MRSRDLIDGFDYNEHMQRQMFCFGSSDDTDSGADSESTYSGSLDFDEEFSGDYGPSTSGPSVGGGGGGGSDGANFYTDPQVAAVYPDAVAAIDAALAASKPTVSAGITAAQVDAMAKAQQDLFGGRAVTHGLSDDKIGYDPVTGMPRGLETVVAPDGQLVTKNLAGLTEAQRQGLPLSMNIAGMMGSNPYAYEIEPVSQRVIGQIGTPGMGLLGQGIDALTNLVLGPPKTFEDLLARGAYTGPNGPPLDGGRDEDPRPPVKPVDPATGQCDEGYMFDEDMQACRLDTRSSMGGQPSLPQVPSQPGGYARMGLLDEAPTNLPQFQQRYGAGFGSPSDFAAANTAFRQQSAYRPEYFKRPYPTDGYTLLS